MTAPATPPASPATEITLGKFHLAAVAFLRARQLRLGARPRVESMGHAPARLAQLEVLAGAVSWSREEKVVATT